MDLDNLNSNKLDNPNMHQVNYWFIFVLKKPNFFYLSSIFASCLSNYQGMAYSIQYTQFVNNNFNIMSISYIDIS